MRHFYTTLSDSHLQYILFYIENAKPIKHRNILFTRTHSYSPELAQSHHHVFPQLKSLKGRKFSSNKVMIEVVEAWFVEQDEMFFKEY